MIVVFPSDKPTNVVNCEKKKRYEQVVAAISSTDRFTNDHVMIGNLIAVIFDLDSRLGSVHSEGKTINSDNHTGLVFCAHLLNTSFQACFRR